MAQNDGTTGASGAAQASNAAVLRGFNIGARRDGPGGQCVYTAHHELAERGGHPTQKLVSQGVEGKQSLAVSHQCPLASSLFALDHARALREHART